MLGGPPWCDGSGGSWQREELSYQLRGKVIDLQSLLLKDLLVVALYAQLGHERTHNSACKL
jgi:hypothetical protein